MPFLDPKNPAKDPLSCELFGCEESNLEVYFCEICNFRTDFLIFFKSHHQLGQKKIIQFSPVLKCENCPFETHSSLVYLKHLRTKCSQNEKFEDPEWSICDLCSYKTTNKKTLNCHVKREHFDLKWIQCDQCTFTTRMDHYLTDHKKTHFPLPQMKNHSQAVKWFECFYCPFKEKSKNAIKDHVIVAHSIPEDAIIRIEQEKGFKCTRCSSKARFRHALITHYRLKHQEVERFFKCEKCSFSTHVKGALKNHVKIQHLKHDKAIENFKQLLLKKKREECIKQKQIEFL